MKEKIVNSERRVCPCCMEEHDVKVVCYDETTLFNDVAVTYEATSFYCDLADEYYDDEHFLNINDINMKDAYRKQVGLLTSKDIANIRGKYGISQADFSIILGWGKKTITRYESHQIQDRAHDSILKRIDADPEWFREFLLDAREQLQEKTYEKYLERINCEFIKQKDSYRRKSIEAKYAEFVKPNEFNGYTELSLDKVVDVIRYFAAANILSLYKTKLMKMMWYADALSVKINGAAITGLVYQAYPMGALPIEHDAIIRLEGVPCKEGFYGENTTYSFSLNEKAECTSLAKEDIKILDAVIEKFGMMTKDQIVSCMHNEKAYVNTAYYDYISFKHAQDLNIGQCL